MDRRGHGNYAVYYLQGRMRGQAEGKKESFF